MRANIFPSAVLLPMLRRASGTTSREAGRVRFLPGLLLPLLLVLTGDVDGVSAQGAPPLMTPVVTPIELPYTVIDDESRTRGRSERSPVAGQRALDRVRLSVSDAAALPG